MLSQRKLYAVLPAKDLARARRFYGEKLGLEPTQEGPEMLIYQSADGTMFQVYQTPNAGTAQNTAMGWMTDDIDAEVADLKARGVVFEEYDMPEIKTVNGIARHGDEESAAWFKDSEGNILCISQHKT